MRYFTAKKAVGRAVTIQSQATLTCVVFEMAELRHAHFQLPAFVPCIQNKQPYELTVLANLISFIVLTLLIVLCDNIDPAKVTAMLTLTWLHEYIPMDLE